MPDKDRPKPRKADVFAKGGGLLDKLRKRRIAVESGDASGGKLERMRQAQSTDNQNY